MILVMTVLLKMVLVNVGNVVLIMLFMIMVWVMMILVMIVLVISHNIGDYIKEDIYYIGDNGITVGGNSNDELIMV